MAERLHTRHRDGTISDSSQTIGSRPSRLLAAGAVAMAVVVATVGLFIRRTGEFASGDCYRRSDSNQVLESSCDEPHDGEILLVLQHPADDAAKHPGNGALPNWAAPQCDAAFASYVGRPESANDRLTYQMWRPELDEWAAADEPPDGWQDPSTPCHCCQTRRTALSGNTRSSREYPMTTAADNRPDAGHGPAWRFIRHYLEMVAAMLAGMAALGVSQLAVEVPGGTGVELVEMAVWMTVPMVAWMRFRGHASRPCAEMALAMLLPAAGALTLLGAGVVTDADTLVMLDHTVMFPAMLVAMLLRRDEYTGHDHGAEPDPVAS